MNKRTHLALLCFTLLLAGAVVFGEPVARLKPLSAPPKKFDPEGEFLPLGKAPAGLEEVASIDLFRSSRGRPFTSHSHSGLTTTRGVVYRFKTIKASQDDCTFETRAIRGISYSFAGRFLKDGVYAEMDSTAWNEPFLEGTVTKYRNGKKVTAASMRFSYFGGT